MLMPEPHRSRHGEYVARYLGDLKSHVIGFGREVMARRKDGTLFPMHISVGEFLADDERMFTAVVHDLTEDAAQRNALPESDERFRQLVNNIDEVFILRTTAPFHYIYISPAVEKVFGLTADEAIADPTRFLSFTHPDDLEFVKRTMEEAGHSSEVEVEYRIIRSDGEERWVWTRYRQVDVAPGDRPLVAVVVTDITTQKHAQSAEALARSEAIRANAAKTEFLSRMSHELRTPMNAILGFAQLLEMDDLSENQLQSVNQILRGGRHLLDLINEVLDISRIDSGQLALSVESVSVSEVVEEVLNLVGPLVAARGLRVLAPTGGKCDELVRADRQRFKQVVLNLVSNAIKYNRVDGEIGWSCERLAGGTVAITISDTGIGIGAEELQRLFTPFDRLGREVTGEEGTGVGLALSQRLVHLMDGRIEVESTPGVGSRFTVNMPLAHPLESSAEETVAPETSATEDVDVRGRRLTELTVVYVEDNLANVRLIEELASRRPGVTLVHAMQGRLALELISSSPPGLVLLDLHLPDMSGEEVLRRLRAEATTKEIPIVVVSADASPSQIRRLIEMGASGYLTKPFDVRELLRWFDDSR